MGQRHGSYRRAVALRHQDVTHSNPKPKCPFVPAREMAQKLWGEKLEQLSQHHGGISKR